MLIAALVINLIILICEIYVLIKVRRKRNIFKYYTFLQNFLTAIVSAIFIVYLILKELNTSQLIINTLSFITMLPAVYLLIRRCKWNQVAFLINDFIVPFLWIFLVIEVNTAFITMCIYHVFQITYDVYGFIEWIKLEKKQKDDAME